MEDNAGPHGVDLTSRLMLDAIGQAVVALDLTGCVTYWNAAAHTVFGWTEAEALGRPADELMHPDLSEAEAFDLFDKLQAGVSWKIESTVQRRDGSRFPAMLANSGIYDDAGGLVGIIGVTTDLTDLKAAEQESLRREARWRALVSRSADVALIADATTLDVTYASPAITRLFGWTPEELIGRNGTRLVHPDDVERVKAAVQVVADDPRHHATVEFRFLRSDGSYCWVEETIANLADEPAVRGLVGNIRDITERRAAEAALRGRDRVTRALAAKAVDAALVVGADRIVRYSNPSASRLLIAGEGETLGGEGFSHVHPDDQQAVREGMEGLKRRNATVSMRYRRLGIDGSWRWVEHLITNCLDDPDIRGLVVNLREITEQVQAEKALRSSEARYRLIAETAQEGIITIDLDGRTLFANQKMADLLGLPLPDLYTKSPFDLAPVELHGEIAWRCNDTLSRGAETFEMPYFHGDGSERLLRISASPLIDDGEHVGSLAMISDVTEARAAERDLQYRAFHDALTGLANRSLLLHRLRDALEPAPSSPPRSVALLLADIDQFKLVNDSLGHASGDDLLIEVARRWSASLRPQDTVARIGGDEFVVLCDGANESEARAVAERLRQALVEPIVLGGRPVAVSASIGIAIASTDRVENAVTLLGHADAAMYEAKGQGRGRTAVFTPRLIDRAQGRLRLFNDLKLAIDRDELQLRFQPVVELMTGRLLGVEALCRWTHPERGVVAPDEFVQAAEESGLIEALDRWVLRRACREAAAMRAAGVLPPGAYVAVNGSAGHLAQAGFEIAVREALADSGLPAQALVLEVTESAVMRDPDAAQVVLERLRDLGVAVAVDDFGTGYSSLAYLRRFPVATLKIDRSFIQGITASADDRAIVTAVIDLANALDVSTIAEGIETRAELELLQKLGCHAGQGFLWSPAVSPQGLADVLSGLRDGRFRVLERRATRQVRGVPSARNVLADLSHGRPVVR